MNLEDFDSHAVFRRFGQLAVVGLAACQLWAATNRSLGEEPMAVPKSPISAEESLNHLRIHPKAKIELVAAEPIVIDPVAIAFDADNLLWVVEMSDYPHGPAEGESPKSRIKILEDRDRDGRFETATVFAEGLLFANGVQPWRGGVIVTLAGEVAWMKDTDGDRRADLKETWFTGFVAENPQLRANHPTFAQDNHIYVANGLRGGEVQAVHPQWRENAKRVSISGRDFRFDPLQGTYEAVTGVGQFGLTFDDFGNRFVCSNRNPCIHVVLPNRYLARNPNVAITGAVHDVSPSAAASRVFPLSAAWTTSTLHAGQFTAACGVTIYRGHELPDEFYGNSFTCEPTGNLVHRDVLAAAGATFTSHPGREGVEFLASPDTWFRPVNTTVGPDGALYVVDMYRAVIEHPQFMPEELKDRPDLHQGNDRGRIYRVVPADRSVAPAAQSQSLARLTNGQLVEQFERINCWQRETAARLLFERQDTTIVSELAAMAKNGKLAAARVQALWTLAGVDGLSPAMVLTALHDSSPRVREHAVRLSERWLASDDNLRGRLIELAEDDDDARLQFQVALSLGQVHDNDEVLSALSRLATESAEDVWTRRAVLSSLGKHPTDFLVDTLEFARQQGVQHKPGFSQLIESLCEVAGAHGEVGRALTSLIDVAPEEMAQHRNVIVSGLIGLGTGLNRRGKSLQGAIQQLSPETRDSLNTVFQQAALIAGDSSAGAASRLQALKLLGHSRYDDAGPVLAHLAIGARQQPIQLAAIDTLSRFRAPNIADILLEEFQTQTPAVRRAIINALLADEARAGRLLDELEAGHLTVIELSATHQTRLKRLRDAALRTRAVKILAASVPADRRQVLDEYSHALELEADPVRGRNVFKRECIICHKIGDLGVDVGPDIADSRTQTPAKLLTAILDPNRAVDANYFSFTIVTEQGKVLNGMIASETASAISLRQPENKTIAILRDEIEEMKSDGISMMPVGFEKKIPVQEMADLISFIKNWRYLDDDQLSRTGAVTSDEN